MIRLRTERGGPEGSFSGIYFGEGMWELDLGCYSSFISEATGISMPEDPSPDDCYRVGNRLESFIQEKKNEGQWDASLAEGYSDVDSLEEIYWVSQFFRECHRLECRIESEPGL